MATRKKSALDDFISSIGSTVNNVVRTFNPGDFSQPRQTNSFQLPSNNSNRVSFKQPTSSQGLFNLGPQRQESRVSLKTQRQKNFQPVDYNIFKPIQDSIYNWALNNPDQANQVLEITKPARRVGEIISKTTPASLELAKANLKGGAANIWNRFEQSTLDQPLRGSGGISNGLRFMGIDTNKLLPKALGGQQQTIRDLALKVKPGLIAERQKPIQDLYNSAQADALKGQQMASTVNVGETGDWQKDLKNPEYLLKAITLNAPSFATGILTTAAVTFLTKNPIIGLSAGFGTSYVQNSGDVYLDAKRNGADEQTARDSANGVGLINAALDTFSIGKILNMIPGGQKARSLILKGVFEKIAKSMVQEGSTESIQQIIQNEVAKVYYDHQRDIFAGVPESLVLGSVMGGGAGGVVALSEGGNVQQIEPKTPVQLPKPEPVLEQPQRSQNPIFNNLNQNDLGLYGSALPQVARDGFWGEPTTQEGIDLQSKVGDDTMSQIAILAQSSKDIDVRRDARKVLYAISDRVYEGSKTDVLQNLKDNLESKGTPEGDIIEQALNNALGAEVINTDTGGQIVESAAMRTGPVTDVNFNMDKGQAEAAIKSMLSDDELMFITGEGDISTKEGEIARGKYYDSIIQVVEQNGKVEDKTVYHEAFHAYADKFADQRLYAMAQEEAGGAENLAEGFAQFMAGRQGFSARLQAFFQDIISKVKTLIGHETAANQMYHELAHGRVGVGLQSRPSISNTAFVKTLANGGVTIDLHGKQPTEGFAYSIRKGQETIIPKEQMTRADIENFMIQNMSELKQPGNHIGIWEEDGQYYIDIAKIGPATAETFRDAIDNGQLAVYDLLGDRSIFTPLSDKYEEINWDSLNREQNGLRDKRVSESSLGANPEITEQPEFRGPEFGPTGADLQTTSEVRPVRREPNPSLITGAQQYAARVGLPPIVENSYVPVNESRAQAIARAYDALPAVDNSIETTNAYSALANEIQNQWDYATNELGIQMEPWTKEGQPYANSQEMVNDVKGGHLYFFTGGEAHPLLGEPDASGLSINDKLRAIHDLFGHASEGYGFGPKGEENAWIKHSQMFSPEAQKALTTETRGQSSWVNFGPQNYDAQGNPLNIPLAERPYAQQKVGLLPDEFTDWQGALNPEQTVFQETPQYRKAENPTEDFPRRPGEINVNRLDLTKAQKKNVRKLSETDDVETLTNDEVLQYAKTAGFDMKSHSTEDVKKVIAERFNTRRQVVELELRADALKKKNAPRNQIVALEKQIAEKSALVASQARSEGQALAARRIMADEISTPRQKVFQLLEKAGVSRDQYVDLAADVDFNDADQVVQFWRDQVPATLGDWVDKVRYNAMLSSLNTHIINVVSNVQGTGLITPVDLTIQGVLDKAVSALTGRPRTRYVGEGLAYGKAFWVGQGKALKSALHILHQGEIFNSDEFDPRLAPLTTKNSFIGKRAVEAALDLPSKLLAGEDALSMTAAEQGQLAALKYRSSKGLKIRNLEGEAKRRAKVSIFRGDLYNPGEGAVNDALGYVAQNLLKKATSPSAPGWVRWPAKMSLPFINIGTNLAKAGFESNPLTGSINLIGNKDKTAAVSKMIMGGAFTLAAVSLAAQGKLVGAEDKDKTKRDAARAAGILPWSLKLDTPYGTQYVQFNKMHPVIAFQLGMVAAMQQAWQEGQLNEDKAEVMIDSVARTLQYFNDQTYWRNVGDFVNVVNGDKYELSQLVANYPMQLIPYRALMAWSTRIVDEYQRAPNPDADLIPAVIQRIEAGVPGLSTNIPAKKGPYGEDVKHPNRLFNLVSPYKTSPLQPENYDIYQKMQERALGNKILKQQSDAKTKEEEKISLLTPDDKRNKVKLDLAKDINRNRIKIGNSSIGSGDAGAGEVSDGVYQFYDDVSGEVQTIDINSFSKAKTGMEKYKQQSDKYAAARKIWGSALSGEQKASAFKKLGLDPQDVRYDYLAAQTEEDSTNYFLDKAQNQSHEWIINRIKTGRVESLSGDMFITNGVLANLRDAGLISSGEYSVLSKLKYGKDGKQIGGGGSGIKLAKVSWQAPKLVKANIKGPSLEGFTPIKAKRSPLPPMPSLKMSNGGYQKKKISLKLPKMATTLSGLGRI